MSKELKVPYIPMNLDTDDLGELKYSEEDFDKGIKASSYLSGVITGLLNTGLEKEHVVELVKTLIHEGSFDTKFGWIE